MPDDRAAVLLEQVMDHFRAVADGVKGNTEAIQELRDRLGRVEEGQQLLGARVAGLEQSVGRLEAEMVEVKTSIVRLDRRMGRRFAKVEGRLDKIEGRLDKVEGRLDKVEGRLDKIEERLDKVEGRLDEVEVGLTGLRTDFNAYRKHSEQRIAALEGAAG